MHCSDCFHDYFPWWRHKIETFFALLAICAGNSAVPSEFPAQRPVTRSFDVFFDLRLNKRLSKQWWGWWFETQPRPLRRQCNEYYCLRWMAQDPVIWKSTLVQVMAWRRKNNKPLPEPVVNQIYIPVWRQQATMSHNITRRITIKIILSNRCFHLKKIIRGDCLWLIFI